MWVDPREDGMAELRALLDRAGRAAGLRRARRGRVGGALRRARRAAAHAAARAAERGEPPVDHGPLPTLDQCRADALVDLLCGTGGARAQVAGGGRAPPGLGWLLAPEGRAPRPPPPSAAARPPCGSRARAGSARRSW